MHIDKVVIFHGWYWINIHTYISILCNVGVLWTSWADPQTRTQSLWKSEKNSFLNKSCIFDKIPIKSENLMPIKEEQWLFSEILSNLSKCDKVFKFQFFRRKSKKNFKGIVFVFAEKSIALFDLQVNFQFASRCD